MEQRDPMIGELLEEIKDAPPQSLAKIIAFVRCERKQREALAGLPDWLVNAPTDDEPLSDEALARIAESDAAIAAGDVHDGEEAFRRLDPRPKRY